jgi:hypothetical protein
MDPARLCAGDLFLTLTLALAPLSARRVLPRAGAGAGARARTRRSGPRVRPRPFVQQKSSRRPATGRLLKLRSSKDYGFGLDEVVVVVSFFSVEAGGLTTVFVVSFFSVVAGGFTTVVLCSTFLSAPGEAAGVTTVSFCSHAPKSAAPAKMQNNFFIGFGLVPVLGPSLNRSSAILRPYR